MIRAFYHAPALQSGASLGIPRLARLSRRLVARLFGKRLPGVKEMDLVRERSRQARVREQAQQLATKYAKS